MSIYNIKSMSINYDGGLSGQLFLRQYDDGRPETIPVPETWDYDYRSGRGLVADKIHALAIPNLQEGDMVLLWVGTHDYDWTSPTVAPAGWNRIPGYRHENGIEADAWWKIADANDVANGFSGFTGDNNTSISSGSTAMATRVPYGRGVGESAYAAGGSSGLTRTLSNVKESSLVMAFWTIGFADGNLAMSGDDLVVVANGRYRSHNWTSNGFAYVNARKTDHSVTSGTADWYSYWLVEVE